MSVGIGLAVVPTVSGCCGDLGGQLKEGVEKSMACREDIKKEVGVDANVSINFSNGKQIVKVALASAPPGDANATKAKVEAIVRKHFPDADEVQVTM